MEGERKRRPRSVRRRTSGGSGSSFRIPPTSRPKRPVPATLMQRLLLKKVVPSHEITVHDGIRSVGGQARARCFTLAGFGVPPRQPTRFFPPVDLKGKKRAASRFHLLALRPPLSVRPSSATKVSQVEPSSLIYLSRPSTQLRPGWALCRDSPRRENTDVSAAPRNNNEISRREGRSSARRGKPRHLRSCQR